MADLKISQLPEADNLSGAVIPIVQDGTNKKAAAALFERVDITGLSDIDVALVDDDEVAVYDASATSNKKSLLSRIWTYIKGKADTTYLNESSEELYSANIVPIVITAGEISTPVNGSTYRLTLDSDIDAGWTAALPTADADIAYYCSVIFDPPTTGGPFSVSIPESWDRLGGQDVISLGVASESIVVTLVSGISSNTIVYTIVALND